MQSDSKLRMTEDPECKDDATCAVTGDRGSLLRLLVTVGTDRRIFQKARSKGEGDARTPEAGQEGLLIYLVQPRLPSTDYFQVDKFRHFDQLKAV